MLYQSKTISTSCGAIVLLKFVESFSFGLESEDKVLDRLMDDFCFTIRTISGQTYHISTKLVAREVGSTDDLPAVAQGIFDAWKFIHK